MTRVKYGLLAVGVFAGMVGLGVWLVGIVYEKLLNSQS